MSVISNEDIEFLTKQSANNISIIIAGMTSLMKDTDNKVSAMESQNWFQRMTKTVLGKNKATKEEIRQNYEKLSAYMAEAVAELYNRGIVEERMIVNLGMQINTVYSECLALKAEHIKLKKTLGEFVSKLNAKIESIDNYHMLFEEIGIGMYSDCKPIIAVSSIVSLIDMRTIDDRRKLNNLNILLKKNNVLSDEPLSIISFLMDFIALPIDEAGQIYMGLDVISNDFLARLFMQVMENYHFLSDMERRFKRPEIIVRQIIDANGLDDSITISTTEIFNSFIYCKSEIGKALEEERISEEKILAQKEEAAEKVAIADKYYYGKGMEKDIEKAWELYLEASKLGNDEATKQLGNICCDRGDYKQAVYYYEIAANHDYAPAVNNLGIRYLDGTGVEIDKIKAFNLFKKAIELGSKAGCFNLGRCYEFGWGTEKNYEKAFEWYLKAAEQGNEEGQCCVAYFYEKGMGTEKNLEKAVEWYEKAAEQNHARAQSQLGWFYIKGSIVNQDYQKAFELCEKSAKQGYVNGQVNVGWLYEMGFGIEKNLEKAAEWYQKAAEQNDSVAQCNLGLAYEHGRGVNQDYRKAFELYEKSAMQGDARAQYFLGTCYRSSYGVRQDLNKTIEWYQKAADQGYEEAAKELPGLLLSKKIAKW